MKAIILSILLSAMSQFASTNEDKNYIECSDKAGNSLILESANDLTATFTNAENEETTLSLNRVFRDEETLQADFVYDREGAYYKTARIGGVLTSGTNQYRKIFESKVTLDNTNYKMRCVVQYRY
jgi:uncharacterized membrane protein affecting hemolysin expression